MFMSVKVLVCVILGAAMRVVPAADWPQFRGPNGDGSAPQANPPLEWSETNHIAWKITLPGRGRSSPVVLGSRIWLTTAVEKNAQPTRIGSDDMLKADHVSQGAVCVDRLSGNILWHQTFFAIDNPDLVHAFNT
jgi:outer membrane protein assembly factor BamB